MSVMTLSTETNHQLRENNSDVCPIWANSKSKMASPTLLFRERRSSPGSSTLTEGTTRSYRAKFLKPCCYLNKKKQIQTGLNYSYRLKCKEGRRDRTGSSFCKRQDNFPLLLKGHLRWTMNMKETASLNARFTKLQTISPSTPRKELPINRF